MPGSVAYLHYGAQSGVTARVGKALTTLGLELESVGVAGPLEWRTTDRRLHISPPVVRHIAEAVGRFGRHALAHRWNTPYAFDAHSRRAGTLLDERRTAVVLQNGALFSPGLPPRRPYVLLLDHTRALSMRHAGAVDYGADWKARERSLYAGAAAIATFSAFVGASLRDDYGVPKERVHVVGAGPNVPLANGPRNDDGRTLLFIGEAFERKGGPVLLEAFARLRRRRPDVRLLVVGPRRAPALPEGATWFGYVPAPRLPELFARATVFVLPTLREPFGLAYLDAMASGLPCIGTRIEAVPEIVRHGRTGLLVPVDDVAALAEAMHRLIDDPARGRAMGQEGRRVVVDEFGWLRVAEQLEALLTRAAEGTPALRPHA